MSRKVLTTPCNQYPEEEIAEEDLVRKASAIIDARVAEGRMSVDDPVYRQFKSLQADVDRIEKETTALRKTVEKQELTLLLMKILDETGQIPATVQ